MSDPILAIRSLRKHYGALRVTDGVDLALLPGTIHAVIGPNGAGKTTLIGQIAGTIRPDSGTITLDGQDITPLPPHRRARAGLARSFQITSVLPDMSVHENATLAVLGTHATPFRLWGGMRAPAAMDVLEQVGLAAKARTKAGVLSHGEKRQLELALALAATPKVMLLDEPLAGAGPEEADRLITLLKTLAGRCAILLVEHDMDAVFQLATEISVLAQGRVIAHGTPAEIRAAPEVRAAYLGEDF